MAVNSEFNFVCCAIARAFEYDAAPLKCAAFTASNWEVVRRLSLRHRVSSLVLPFLEGHSNPPQALIDSLRRRVTTDGARNALHLDELGRLFSSFKASGIKAAAYKGAALAAYFYHSIAQRPCDDIDLLVETSDVERTLEVLQSHSYRLTQSFTKCQLKFELFTQCALSLRHKTLPIQIDLHTRIIERRFQPSIPTSTLLRESKQVNYKDSFIDCLTPEHNLLVLCLHGSKHGWNRLIWVADIVAILKSKDAPDPKLVTQLAERFGLMATLTLGLRLAQRVYPCMGRPYLELTGQVSKKNASIEEGIFLDLQQAEKKPMPLAKHLIRHLNMQNCHTARAAYFFCRVLTPNSIDYKTISIPDNLFFLYFIIRPIRLILTYLRHCGSFLSKICSIASTSGLKMSSKRVRVSNFIPDLR